MLVLEYALQEFKISFADLARELNIDRSNITIWLSGKRPIPKKYLPILSQKLDIPETWLSETLTDIRKLEIDNIKIKRELNDDVIQYRDIDLIRLNQAQIEHAKA